jgi:energy-converting hydrogenase Eha subunit A
MINVCHASSCQKDYGRFVIQEWTGRGPSLPVHEEEEVVAMTTANTRRASPRAFLGKAGHFVLHYLEMCLACCVGGVTLGVAFFGGAALVGYPDLIVRAPYFSTLVLAVVLTVPMVAWMRFRHHGWRPSLEMGAATMGLGIVLIALGTIGVVPLGDMFEWVTRLACPVMLVPMLARPNLYTGNMDHRAHAA